MKKLATALFFILSGLLPINSFATLQGKWNVTEFVTITTSLGKQVQYQAQDNQTSFTFGTDSGFSRDSQGIQLFSGKYKRNVKKSTFAITIKNNSINQDSVNTIKSRIRANLAVRGYDLLSFNVKTNSFTGKIYNESVSTSSLLPLELPEDVHEIHGTYSYTITMRVQSTFSEKKRYKMTIKVKSTFNGSKDAAETTSPDAVIAKQQLWPIL